MCLDCLLSDCYTILGDFLVFWVIVRVILCDYQSPPGFCDSAIDEFIANQANSAIFTRALKFFVSATDFSAYFGLRCVPLMSSHCALSSKGCFSFKKME